MLYTVSFADPLSSWNEGVLKAQIVHFLEDLSDSNSKNFVPDSLRRAFFDLDGTIICEKPTYIESAFVVAHIKKRIAQDSTLLYHELYRKVAQNDTAYINAHIKEIILESFIGASLETVEENAREFLTKEKNQIFHMPYIDLLYKPMIQLIQLLKEYQFDVYIVSTSQQEYIRAMTPSPLPLEKQEILSTMVGFQEQAKNGKITFNRINTYFTPYCEEKNKAVRIRERALFPGQIAVGNTMGDFPMLKTTAILNPHQSLIMVLNHDDSIREVHYIDSILLDSVKANNWEYISMRKDFKEVFLQKR